MVHEQLSKFYRFPPRRPPDGGDDRRGRCAVAFYHDAMDFSDAEHRNVSFNRLVAKLPTIVAMALQVQHRHAVHVPGQRSGLHRELHAHDVRQPCEK